MALEEISLLAGPEGPVIAAAVKAAVKAAQMAFYVTMCCCVISTIICFSTFVASFTAKDENKKSSLRGTWIAFLVLCTCMAALACFSHEFIPFARRTRSDEEIRSESQRRLEEPQGRSGLYLVLRDGVSHVDFIRDVRLELIRQCARLCVIPEVALNHSGNAGIYATLRRVRNLLGLTRRVLLCLILSLEGQGPGSVLGHLFGEVRHGRHLLLITHIKCSRPAERPRR
ncbi:hypothetical protein [Yellowstone lake phycodnavirus 3]|uniref:hypothetical protein n=1 Tax=Yellowstone lake phycodnavirus 3 TaxID=1586715 RepID=UPI0006EB5394|nr:hypothetical protein AR677_gp058 [Yellowstone lake phycodnavirus 3]BAT22557.1 hypothetical protein [Yellowstone lake phycodnavirus 3]